MTQLNQRLIDELRADTARLVREMEDEMSTPNTRTANPSTAPQAPAPQGYEALTREEYKWLMDHIAHASDMMMLNDTTAPTLLDPILPRQGVVALVGSSDSGKSTLLRGLAMAIVRGDSEYIGFGLNSRYRRAIYVSTEDDAQSLGSLMRRQTASPTPDEAMRYDGLHFIFDTENLLETLELGLKSYPPDVVIVDAFADLYCGPMNENNRVRSFLQGFADLAQRYDTLFIFLHHTGKRTESLAPSKHNAIGSQGFEAKMRLMMELRTDPERADIRHLCIVKGNYLSADYKRESFALRFTPELNFEATGERVRFEELRERNPERDSEELEKLELIRSMQAEGRTQQQIADALGYKDRSTIAKIIKRMSE